MYTDDTLADLPEALPLRRVSPAWRIFAVFEAVLLIALFLFVCVLGIAFLQHRTAVQTAASTPVTRPAVWMPPGVPPAGGEDAADAQNLPYPTREDLRNPPPKEPPEEQASSRQRFLGRAAEVWQSPKGHFPSNVVISPDGQSLAYLAGEHLMAGPVNEPKEIGEVPDPADAGGGAVMVMPGGGKSRMIGLRPQRSDGEDRARQLAGVPSWSADSRFIFVARAGGEIWRCNPNVPTPERLSFRGTSPATVPNDPDALLFVRSRPTAKPDVGGLPAGADPSEVMYGNLSDGTARVLIPAGPSAWSHLAVSPDGKRLALVSDRGSEVKQPRWWRVFLMELKEGAEPKPVTAPAETVGPVCWTPDGKALVYARSQNPAPPEFWSEEHAGLHRNVDLFLWDLDANRETRLSRGGSCYSPSVDKDGNLTFVTWAPDKTTGNVRLRKLPLAEARAFAAGEPDPPMRDAAGWAELAEQVTREAKVSDDTDGSTLTTEALNRLAGLFTRLYRERFKTDPPADIAAFDRQRKELLALDLSYATWRYLAFVLGAAEGDLVVRQGLAKWSLGKGPLLPSTPHQPDDGAEGPFGYVAYPFRRGGADASGGSSETLGEQVRRAQGRPLVLTNDAATGRVAAEALGDPDLTRGMALLKEGRAEDACRLLLDLTRKKEQERNYHLALVVGRALHDNGQKGALLELTERIGVAEPLDARKFNLWGLALLLRGQKKDDPEPNPQEAIEKLKSALRCDLHFGPAYLNLAQAYQQANDATAARACLLRYLDLMPRGVYAPDAQRRLAELETGTK